MGTDGCIGRDTAAHVLRRRSPNKQDLIHPHLAGRAIKRGQGLGSNLTSFGYALQNPAHNQTAFPTMSGQGGVSNNAPLNARAAVRSSYGGTLTTGDRLSRDESGSLYLPDNVPQLRRQGSSRTVRMNAVEDGAGALSRGINFFTFSLVDMFLIVLGTVVLGLHWKDKPVVCHSSSDADDDSWLNDSWRRWALVAVMLKVAITFVCLVRWKLEEPSEINEAHAQKIKEVLDFLNFVQFFWSFFGLRVLLASRSCENRSDSPIYQLCLVYMVIFFAPIVMVLVLALALCCCLPTVLGAMRRLSLQRTGARQEEIERLPVVKYSQHEPMEESCAICLVNYDAEDDLRKLPCDHAFHPPCVDSWLAVNASCPICRAPCIADREQETDTIAEEATPFRAGLEETSLLLV